ncbi:MAG: cysteine--tRNA ligase [Fervidicoccaceae archaeon]
MNSEEAQELLRLKLYNTLTRRVEEFEPSTPGLVKMYVCGPTVYDETHVGHARTYVAFDSLRRFMESRGALVIYVQNITDIDDKIIKRAQELNVAWRDVAETYIKDYAEALQRLGVEPVIHPRVTEHIDDIISFVSLLLEKGFAYVSHGSVYFDVARFPDYGRLSGRLERESWRQEEELLREKRNPFDFALWKRAKPGEPSWDSPWGPGRPGWHIECSVMSTKYLGEDVDVHGGGQDLIFPHHENERAQCEALLGKRWVRHWVHTGMLTVRGEKMSKSLGNIVTLRELLSKFDGGVLRTWILSSHYRSQLDFLEESLEQAKKARDRIIAALRKVEDLVASSSSDYSLSERDVELASRIATLFSRMEESLAEDFNTGRALAEVLEAVKLFHRDIEDSPKLAHLLMLRRVLGFADEIYGFSVGLEKPERRGIERELIEALVRARAELRRRKLFDAADALREELKRLGVILVDRGTETRWYYASERAGEEPPGR